MNNLSELDSCKFSEKNIKFRSFETIKYLSFLMILIVLHFSFSCTLWPLASVQVNIDNALWKVQESNFKSSAIFMLLRTEITIKIKLSFIWLFWSFNYISYFYWTNPFWCLPDTFIFNISCNSKLKSLIFS